MRTVAETPIFQKYAESIWSEDELQQFIAWIALNPEAGDVIPGSGGCRKVRWSVDGQGKRGGARVVYFLPNQEVIWLLICYKKAKFDDLPRPYIAAMRKAVEDAL